MIVKTTKHPVLPVDAALFQLFIERWQKRLNLGDWRIVRSPKTTSAMAAVHDTDVEARLAHYRLGRHFGTTEVTPHALEQTAVHELLHVRLAEFKWLARDPDVPEDVLMAAEHAIVHTLEALLVPDPESKPEGGA